MRIACGIALVEYEKAVEITEVFQNIGEAVYAVPLVVDAGFALRTDFGDDLFGIDIGADAERVIGLFAAELLQPAFYFFKVRPKAQLFAVVAVVRDVFMVQVFQTA